MDTLGSMKAQLGRWLKEDEDPLLLADAINDAVESLWRSIILIHLGQFLGGPVTLPSNGLVQGAERVNIVSISDPLSGPALNVVAGGALAGRTIACAYAYITESGSMTKVSPVVNQVVPANNLVKFLPPAYVSGAIGWVPFASDVVGGARLAQQVGQFVDFSASWIEPDDTGVIDDPDLPAAPLNNTTADDIFYIRVLQVQNTDGTYKTWTAGDLDGLLFKRASASTASSSTYQNYAYDFVNGRTIEVRPAMGTTLTPRYFFVQKPRRLRFDQAYIPFTNLSYTEFVRTYANAQLSLSNHEYADHTLLSGQAERVRMEILQGLNTQATRKQQSITPFFNW